MTRYVYCNGRYTPYDKSFIHVEDRGFQYADGIYEVVAVVKGIFVDLEPHLDRLEYSLNEIKLPPPVSRSVLKVILQEVLTLNRIVDGNIYLQITRGCGPSHKRYFGFPEQITPSLVVVARPFDHQAFLKSKEKGIKCLSMKDWRWKRPDIKTTNLLPAVLSKQEACDQGFDDVIWFDDDGFVTEATASNVWIIKNGILITRPASGAILGGITRLRLIELAKNLGYEVKEECFTLKDIYDSEEAFLSSSNICALPINSVDRNTLKNAPNFNHVLGLQRAYEEFCAYLNV